MTSKLRLNIFVKSIAINKEKSWLNKPLTINGDRTEHILLPMRLVLTFTNMRCDHNVFILLL